MSAEVTVLQERLLAQEDAQLRLANQLTLLHDQNQQLRTTVVALEAHLERKGREMQALAGLVDVDAAIAPLQGSSPAGGGGGPSSAGSPSRAGFALSGDEMPTSRTTPTLAR